MNTKLIILYLTALVSSISIGLVLERDGPTDYEIEKDIGMGSFAIVYKAFKLSTKTTVAIKMPLPEESLAEAEVEILREKNMMLELKDSKYSMKLIDSFIGYANLTHLVLPYAENGDLLSYTRGSQGKSMLLSNDELTTFQFRMMTEIAHGLKEIHDKGICHLGIAFYINT
jgi:serine/threonine protein kinase